MDKLTNYIPSDIDCHVGDIMNSVLIELASLDLVEYLGENNSVDDGIIAMSCCLSISEIKLLFKRTLKSTSSMNKRDMLDQIIHSIRTSRDLFGKQLNWFRLIQESMLCGPSVKPHIVRVKPAVLHLIRRLERLVQIHATEVLSSHPSQSLSVHQPLGFKAALLVIFKKIRFPTYELSVAPTFSSKVDFLMWEAAIELKSVWFELSAASRKFSGTLGCRLYAIWMDSFVARISGAVRIFETCLSEIRGNNQESYVDLSGVCRLLLSSAANPPLRMTIGCEDDPISVSELDIGERITLIAAACLHEYFANRGGPSHQFDIYEAGCVLVSICRKGVRALEQRGSDTGYSLAVVVMRTVLGTPFPRSRLKWLDRLLIDLKHLRRDDEALAEAVKGRVEANTAGESIVADMLDRRLSSKRLRPSDSPPKPLQTLPLLLQSISSAQEEEVLVLEAWQCGVCTLMNGFGSSKCAACNYTKKAATVPIVLPASGADCSSSVSPESGRAQWSCAACTFLNPRCIERCSVCDTVRELQSSVSRRATSAPPTQEKRKRSPAGAGTGGSEVGNSDLAMADADADAELGSATLQLLGLGSDLAQEQSWSPPLVTVTGHRLSRGEGLAKGGKSRYVSSSDNVVGVEDLALEAIGQGEAVGEQGSAFAQRLAGGHWVGWHCEGAVLRSVFGLLFWDVLFGPTSDAAACVPVFVSPYQDAPLDLDTAGTFYLNRADIIEKRLLHIQTACEWGLASELADRYRSCYRQRCRGVTWDTPLKVLCATVVCLKGPALALTCRALASDYRYFSGGLPDLFLVRASVDKDDGSAEFLDFEAWLGRGCLEIGVDLLDDVVGKADAEAEAEGLNSDEDTEPTADTSKSGSVDIFHCEAEGLERPEGHWQFEACFVEVKGPSDSLSRRQWTWLKYLDDGGVLAGVCAVKEQDGPASAGKRRKGKGAGPYVRLSAV